MNYTQSASVCQQETPPVELRPYQHEIVAQTLQFFRNGGTSGLISLPTGTGKTIIFCAIANRLNVPTLVLAHRDELIHQTVDKIRNIDPDADIGIVKAEANDVDAQITVASIQTIARENRLLELRDDIELIVTDECHHAAADSYKRVYHRFGVYPESPDDIPLAPLPSTGKRHLGVTATPMRNDDRGLAQIYSEVIYAGVYANFVDDGWLCDLRFEGVPCRLNLKGVETTRLSEYGTDYKTDSLAEAVNKDEITQDIFSAYKQLASDRKRTLAFCVNRQHAKSLCEYFSAQSVKCGYIDFKTPAQERSATLSSFEAGEINVLFNCMIFTEGFDCPSIDCILLARPTQSPSLLTQIIGRGTRPAPGKEDCLILDVAHAYRENGTLIELASLFHPPVAVLDNDRDNITSSREQSTGDGGTAQPEDFTQFRTDTYSVLSISEILYQYEPVHPWERGNATDKQRRFASKLLQHARKQLNDDDYFAALKIVRTGTKGQASKIIDALSKRTGFAPTPRRPGNTCPECGNFKQPQFKFCYPCNQRNRGGL